MKTEKECFYADPHHGERPEIGLIQTETNGVIDEQAINCGYIPVVLQKMFGPLIFCDIRIRAHYPTCEWIVEKQITITGADGNDDLKWVEVIRIPGQ
jgi:hypothetical protein